jgi:hypothetical protein
VLYARATQLLHTTMYMMLPWRCTATLLQGCSIQGDMSHRIGDVIQRRDSHKEPLTPPELPHVLQVDTQQAGRVRLLLQTRWQLYCITTDSSAWRA